MAEPGAPEARSPDQRLFTPAFIALSLAELAYFTAEGLTIPVTPLFARGPIGASVEGVGLAVGAFSVTALVLRPYAGRLADRVGRRPLLVGGALAYAAILAVHALVDSLPMLVGLRLLLGAAEAFFFVAGFAAVADLAPPGRTGEALSFNSLSLYLGVALGPVLGLLLVDVGGFSLAWLGGAALALAAAALAWRIPEPARPARSLSDRGDSPLFQRAVIGPSVALFSGIVAMAGFFAFVAIYASETLQFDGASTVLFVFGLVVVAARVAFARLPDRVAPFRLGTVALALCALGLLIVSVLWDGRRALRRSDRPRARSGLHDAGDVRGHLRAGRALAAWFGLGNGEPLPRSRVRRWPDGAGPGRRSGGDSGRLRGCRVGRGRGRGGLGHRRAPRRSRQHARRRPPGLDGRVGHADRLTASAPPITCPGPRRRDRPRSGRSCRTPSSRRRCARQSPHRRRLPWMRRPSRRCCAC